MFVCPPSILVVDDDAWVRDVVVTLLRDAEFRVEEARSAPEALDLIDRDEFDVAIVDVCLPGGCNGVELVRWARLQKPRLRCLFISGFSNPVVDEPVERPVEMVELRPAELLGCVWEVLQRTPLQRPRRRPAWAGKAIDHGK